MNHKAYLLTGGNLGDRAANLASALENIKQQLGNITAASPLYQTAPWGFAHETPFLNQALLLETSLSAEELMKGILLIEKSMGRIREGDQWKERLIDIDILFYDNDIVNTEGLHIPHPRLHQRRFVLEPMAAIAPNLLHPVLKKTISELLLECEDTLEAKPFIA